MGLHRSHQSHGQSHRKRGLWTRYQQQGLGRGRGVGQEMAHWYPKHSSFCLNVLVTNSWPVKKAMR